MKKLYTIILVLSMVLINTVSFGNSYTWKGSVDTIFTNASNWLPNTGYPGSMDTAIIVTGSPHRPTLNANQTVYYLRINSGIIDLQGNSLTVQGYSDFNAGTANNGTLVIRGNLAQFDGTDFNTRLDVEAGVIQLNGGTFNEESYFEANGPSNSVGSGGCIFNAKVTLVQNTNRGFYLSYSNGDEFNDTLNIYLLNSGPLYLSNSDTSYYNENVYISNEGSNDISFGNNGGLSYLASGSVLAIGDSGYAANDLFLNKFTQLGSTTQNLTFTGSATVYLSNCTFNGVLSLTAPGILSESSIFNNEATIVKTGTGNNFWSGNNKFYGETSINSNGSGDSTTILRLSNAYGNWFYSDASFESSSKTIQIDYNDTTRFSGDVTLNGNFIYFKNYTLFNGSTTQNLESNKPVTFEFLEINKSSGTLDLDTIITISRDLSLNKGIINNNANSLLILTNFSSVNNASDSCFISGPVKKIGNSAFEFPVGKGIKYQSLIISAPSNASDGFVAEYFDYGQPFGESLDSSLATIDHCNFWKLLRTEGTSDIDITFSWSDSLCTIRDTSFLKIANWDSTAWIDLGHGEVNGNYASGTIKTSSLINSFGAFTFAYDTSALLVDDVFNYPKGEGFVANHGQLIRTDTSLASEVLYYGRASSTRVFFCDSIVSYVFIANSDVYFPDSLKSVDGVDSLYRVDMKFVNGNFSSNIEVTDSSQGYNNYYLSYLDSGITNVPTVQEIRYNSIYPGIDVAFYNGDIIKFYLDSNADINDIHFYYQGSDSLGIDENSMVRIYSPFGYMSYEAKYFRFTEGIWDEQDIEIFIEDSIIKVDSVASNSGERIIIFSPSTSHPHGNPQNLRKWVTYCGGGGNTSEEIKDIKIDLDDNIYAVGSTESINFPFSPDVVQIVLAGNFDAFVIVFDSDRAKKCATYYGGLMDDWGEGIDVDNNSNICIVGSTTSPAMPDCTNPPCSGYNQNNSSTTSGFIAKLTSNLETLTMSTCYGGSQPTTLRRIKFDSLNNIYAMGNTAGSVPLPSLMIGFHQSHKGSDDALITQFSSSNELVWATHLGGSDAETAYGLAIDQNSNVYVSGTTFSVTTSNLGSPCISNNSSNFPICAPSGPAYIQSNSTSLEENGFICKFNELRLLVWSTLFGGTDIDQCFGVEVSKLNGDIVVGGSTWSDYNENFPIYDLPSSNLNITTISSDMDAFISVFESNYTQKWCTYFGGDVIVSFIYPPADVIYEVCINDLGETYLLGWTQSENLYTLFSSGFYDDVLGVGTSSIYSALNGDIFILKLDPHYNLTYSSYFGGEGHENPMGADFQEDSYRTGKYDLVFGGYTTSGNPPGQTDQFPLSNYLGSAGIPYYDPDLITTTFGVAAYIANLYNIHTPYREQNFIQSIYTISQNHDITVFPNPFIDQVMISCHNQNIELIKIFDIFGRLLFFTKGIGSSQLLELNEIVKNQSVCIVEVYTNKAKRSLKLIKY